MPRHRDVRRSRYIAGRHQHGYLAHARNESHLKRLRRIGGQARGLQRMVEEEQYCIAILTQVAATTKPLHVVALGLVDDHMARRVADASFAPEVTPPISQRKEPWFRPAATPLRV